MSSTRRTRRAAAIRRNQRRKTYPRQGVLDRQADEFLRRRGFDEKGRPAKP